MGRGKAEVALRVGGGSAGKQGQMRAAVSCSLSPPPNAPSVLSPPQPFNCQARLLRRRRGLDAPVAGAPPPLAPRIAALQAVEAALQARGRRGAEGAHAGTPLRLCGCRHRCCCCCRQPSTRPSRRRWSPSTRPSSLVRRRARKSGGSTICTGRASAPRLTTLGRTSRAATRPHSSFPLFLPAAASGGIPGFTAEASAAAASGHRLLRALGAEQARLNAAVLQGIRALGGRVRRGRGSRRVSFL